MGRKRNAFLETLYRAEYKKLLLYAQAVMQESSRAEDLVQDTFHEALRHLELLQAHEHPAAWLMQTLKNKIHTEERTRKRYLLRFISLEQDFGAQDRELEWLLEEARDEAVVLQELQEHLSEEEFYLLRRLVLEQSGHLQVSRELGISVWSCQKRLERIRKKLAKYYPQYQRKQKQNKHLTMTVGDGKEIP